MSSPRRRRMIYQPRGERALRFHGGYTPHERNWIFTLPLPFLSFTRRLSFSSMSACFSIAPSLAKFQNFDIPRNVFNWFARNHDEWNALSINLRNSKQCLFNILHYMQKICPFVLHFRKKLGKERKREESSFSRLFTKFIRCQSTRENNRETKS